jgi:Sigma-54 interaction domain
MTSEAQAWSPSTARPSRPSRAFETILTYQPRDVGISDADWSVLLASGVNVLVVGPDAAIVRLWTAVWSTLRKPVCWVEAGRLWFPPESAGTLVLRNVDELSRKDQERLFYWLQQEGRSTRVLASAPRVLFHQVEAGTFLSALYYRLNTLHLSLNVLHQA